MIRNAVIFAIMSFILLACKQSQNKKNELVETIIEDEIPSAIWHYSAYLDSIITKKTIFKYSWTCASFAYEIAYDKSNPDSILFTGYNEVFKMPLVKKDFHTYWAGDTIQHWILNFSNDYNSLTIKEYMYPTYAQKADPNAYDFLKIGTKIDTLSKYFIKNILAGNYKTDDKEISLTDYFESSDGFSDYYKIIGIDSAFTYSLVINFWEMVPQMDLINLYREDGTFYKNLNWSFNEDTLILRNVKEKYKDGDFDGGIADTILYKLLKIK